ncbi:hypothetical protein I5A55_005032 [Salmonella enterica]|jgi:hypothetical protein|nr:hypothetical protein [Salmonella enterica]EHC7296473.1 hypothetical protein [Salmonella enterica]EIT9566390.1 hypothetical protein [Escherichia coli]
MDKLTLLDMFKHGTATWSAVSSFVVVLFWCVGCWLAFLAIVNYKNAADGKSGIAKPIVQTVIASLMVAISKFIPILSDTLNNKAAEFSPQSLLSDIPQDALGLNLAFTSVLLFVQMLGTIAIFRGMLMLWEATNKGAGSGLIGKSWTHIIGGVLAVNIQLTIATVASTFYPGVDLSFLGF